VRFPRRSFLQVAGAGLILPSGLARGQRTPVFRTSELPETPLEPVREYPNRSTVALVHGENRRKNAYDALMAIDHQIQPLLKSKKHVIIKPNLLIGSVPLAVTHADALRGILDYLAPRSKGPVVIAESSAGDTLEGYDLLGYHRLVSEYPSLHVSLVDLNREKRYETIPLIDFDIHVSPVRLAARLFDPDAFIICSAVLKAHNFMVVTLSVKNMTLGAPPHSVQGETPRWNEKRKYHIGVRGAHYNIFLTAQKMLPYWGVTLIDGFEGMEGNGPARGTPVASKLAIASTDFIAADRVGVEAMAVNPAWVGYLRYCAQNGLGQYDLSKIDVIGAYVADVRKPYRLHDDIDLQLQWMGPMRDLPPSLGFRRDINSEIFG
jgi:uncharacterized protein (DUF362 family)